MLLQKELICSLIFIPCRQSLTDCRHIRTIQLESPCPVGGIKKNNKRILQLAKPGPGILIPKIDNREIECQHKHKPRHKAQYPSHIKFPDADRALSLIFLQKEQRNEKAAQHKKNINPDKCPRKSLNPCMKQKNKDNGNTAYCIERRILL